MKITEKAAYIKGLIEGMELDLTTPTGKLFGEISELLTEMADEIKKLSENARELREYVEELDDDLTDVEDDLYEIDEDEDEDDDDEDEDDDEANFYEATCPSCGEVVCFDDSLDPENIVCPACGEKFSCVCDGECEKCDEDCTLDDDEKDDE